ncbi:MAG: universal stress protein [Kiloniellales bacterium]
MAYRDLLLILDDSRGAAIRLQAALEFAKRHNSSVDALHLSMRQEIPGYVAAEITSDVLSLRDEAIAKDAASAEQSFRAACEGAGVKGRFGHKTGSAGDLADATIAAGRLSDLVVLGQPEEDGGGWLGPWLLETVLLGCGRPVLLVPYIGTHDTVGKKVLVAWDGGREAARAVGDALPLLMEAEEVTVVSVNRDPDSQRPSTAAVSEHLKRHGVPAESHDAKIDDISATDYMLNRASDEGADLLVMGAYAHSRIRELVLGGMTKRMLKHMTVPIFMSH